MGGNMFLEIMGLRFLSLLFAFVLQSSLSAAYQNPHYRAFGRQDELDPVRAVKATPPCCGLCKLQAQTVQLYYWPNQATTAVPSVTGLPKNASAVVSAFAHNGSGIYVDDSGFTFTSPSVYIGFTSLGATDLCGAVGTVLYNTTVGFDPGELSSYETTTTETCYFSPSTVGGTVTQQPSGYLMSTNNRPLNYASVAQNCSTINGYYYFPDDPFNHLAAGDPCHPIIAIPDRIKRLQPDWESCIADAYGGFYDPPKTLQQVFALMPTADPGLTSIAALPQQTPSPPPLQTAQPTLEPEKPSTPSLPPQPQPTPQDPPSSQDPRPADPTSQDSVSQSPASQNPVPQPANPEGPVSQDPSPKSPIPPDTVPQTPTSEKPAAQSPPPQAPISQNPTTDDPMESQAPAPGFTTSITLFPPPVPVEVPQTPPPIVTPTPAGAVTESPSNLPASPSDNRSLQISFPAILLQTHQTVFPAVLPQSHRLIPLIMLL
ncbi:hypothetical protein GQ43DRAFT_270540 [Delitschia confertaspora ATCC 74209]|uniref:Uncharacterized protein n=1 Tax=Delitschia confertaspora ATCC 74209 TaxID=1513339 RepID=A0A9P4MX26_9PLEO|nr:hypothetical protein GQ43DRAFT_270540 [Delitschia confertaspora ATCC 74209]